MLDQDDHSGGNRAVAVLATAFVVVAGLVTCTFISLAAGGDVAETVKSTGILLAVVLFLMWLVRDRAPGSGTASAAWGWLSRKRRPRIAYHLESRPRTTPTTTAPIAPPTAESIRNLAGGINTWVPSTNAKRESDNQARRDA